MIIRLVKMAKQVGHDDSNEYAGLISTRYFGNGNSRDWGLAEQARTDAHPRTWPIQIGYSLQKIYLPNPLTIRICSMDQLAPWPKFLLMTCFRNTNDNSTAFQLPRDRYLVLFAKTIVLQTLRFGSTLVDICCVMALYLRSESSSSTWST